MMMIHVSYLSKSHNTSAQLPVLVR